MKNSFINSITVITILFTTIGCEKDNQDIDYRIPFIGNFSFVSYSYTKHFGLYDSGDTIVFQGSIDLDNEKDSVIIINYRPPDSEGWICNGKKIYGSKITPFIHVNGYLNYPNSYDFCVSRTRFSGSFYSTDSLYFDISNISVGGRWGHVVSGTRK